jgi:molecular chaperone DnaK (HSP70)
VTVKGIDSGTASIDKPLRQTQAQTNERDEHPENADSVTDVWVSGDAHLGGRDFDDVLMQSCLKPFDRSGRTTVETITKQQSRLLRMSCEKAKSS